MKSVLIVYATREGQTEKISRFMREELIAHGEQVLLHNAKDKLTHDMNAFDVVLIGGSMHVGGIESELKTFLKEHKTVLEAKKKSFFLVLMSAATKDPEERKRALSDAKTKLERALPVSFDHIEMIAGALAYTKYNWFVKMIMKRIAKQQGGATDTSQDHEYTNWDLVKRYVLDAVQ